MIEHLKKASKAAAIHFSVSIFFACVVAALVFLLWFPSPYREWLDAGHLFLIIVCVDVICGPLLTLVLFNPKKPRKELIQDIGLVVFAQLLVLSYGLHTVLITRPLWLAFAHDEFVIVTRVDIDVQQLPNAQPELQSMNWGGPRLLGVHIPQYQDPDYQEVYRRSLQGHPPVFRPEMWRPYDAVRAGVVKQAKKNGGFDQLIEKNPEQREAIEKAIANTSRKMDELGFIPVQTRLSADYVALVSLDEKDKGEVLGFVQASWN